MKQPCIFLLKKHFLAFEFVGSAWSWFFHPRHDGQLPPTSKDFHPRFYPLHLFSYLNSSERTSISLFSVECQTRELLEPFLKRLCFDAVLGWGLNSGPPTLESSTIPLGYQWGGDYLSKMVLWVIGNSYLHKHTGQHSPLVLVGLSQFKGGQSRCLQSIVPFYK